MTPVLRPMLASLADAPLDDPQLVYEPKYDGIRAIVEVEPGHGKRAPSVRLWSRLGNDKTTQFPEIAAALATWAKQRLRSPVVLDGEIVALDDKGEPTGFQQLQGRIHVVDARSEATARVALIAFDLLREGARDLRDLPLHERRAALERLFARTRSPLLRISEQVRGDGRAMYTRALNSGWEGLIAKQHDSPYQTGKRTPDWRKLKIVREQEFVVGGWTEPRQSRPYFGALLLGVYAPVLEGRHKGSDRELVYVGHTGTGFNERELARVMKLLEARETGTCPFSRRPKTNERPHWVRPDLVAQIKFTEWTADAKLRHPVYLGLRDDKRPEDVQREAESRLNASTTARLRAVPVEAKRRIPEFDPSSIVAQLQALEDSRRDGIVDLPDGAQLNVGNLHKVFWPRQKLTKGDLLRYYAQVAPALLPVVADRPLVMKRLPNGIGGKSFYQQRAPDDVPDGVRVERVSIDQQVPNRLVGGNLKTLLYTTQLGAISQDPWFSRVQSPTFADHVALDLDPMPDVPFGRVLDVARWIRDELAALGAVGFPKTSGADGLHIYLPLPPGTPYDAGLLFCQIVATVVAHRHPKVATIERAVRARGSRVYIDFLQNIPGKTLACAYSARASEYAGVSAPLTWEEVGGRVKREDFTITTMVARLREVGDLWGGLRRAKGIDLSRVARYAEATGD